MFVLPQRFNFIYNSLQAKPGVNILVPMSGKTKLPMQYYKNVAARATSERMITPVLHELRTNVFRCNDFSVKESTSMNHVLEGISHSVYNIFTPLYFRSTILEQILPYTDYAYILNAAILAHKLLTGESNSGFKEFNNWFRMYDLRTELSKVNGTSYLKIIRGNTELYSWHEELWTHAAVWLMDESDIIGNETLARKLNVSVDKLLAELLNIRNVIAPLNLSLKVQ